MNAGTFSASTNSSTGTASTCGLMPRAIAAITWAFFCPSVLVNARAWRLRLLGCTVSWSTSTRHPTPPRTRASAQLDPTPPRPSTTTLEARRRATPSSPRMRTNREADDSSDATQALLSTEAYLSDRAK